MSGLKFISILDSTELFMLMALFHLQPLQIRQLGKQLSGCVSQMVRIYVSESRPTKLMANPLLYKDSEFIVMKFLQI